MGGFDFYKVFHSFGRIFLLNETVYDVNCPGGGELSFSAWPGVGNGTLSEKNIANSWGCARVGEGVVTGRIEPCIKPYLFD